MSKLNKLLGKPQEFIIGGEKFELHPLKMIDLPLLMLMNDSDPQKQAKALQDLVKKTLKMSVPDATDDEIDNIGINHFQQLSEAIMVVNGFDKEEAKKIAQGSDVNKIPS